MHIEVHSDSQYEEYDDFDPVSAVQKGEVKLNCMTCVDGKIRITEEDDSATTAPTLHLKCGVCSAFEDIERDDLFELLRRILIDNIPVAGGNDNQVQLYPSDS